MERIDISKINSEDADKIVKNMRPGEMVEIIDSTSRLAQTKDFLYKQYAEAMKSQEDSRRFLTELKKFVLDEL